MLAQGGDFFKPADTLRPERLRNVIIGASGGTALTYLGLAQTWYSDYPRTDFHFKNDNAQWLQMDKAGHVFATYQMSRFGSDLLRWTGLPQEKSIWYGTAFGFAFVSAIEILDGYSAQWGASWGDIAANAGGAALFVGQEALWKEQRIIPKFSFHTTPYASARPNVLGSTLQEQILKDYNGQTYWLSANLNAFLPDAGLPTWLNVAVGYGAEGMITGDDELVNTIFFPEKERVRQFYFSLDADLTRIKTQSHFLKTLFSVVNTVKIPAPTLEIRGDGIVKFRPLYF